jgi:hypothetical protein
MYESKHQQAIRLTQASLDATTCAMLKACNNHTFLHPAQKAACMQILIALVVSGYREEKEEEWEALIVSHTV